MLYVDGNAKLGEAEVFRCPYCRDGRLIKAWRKLLDGKNEMLAAYRIGTTPDESTYRKIEEAKIELGILF